MHIFKIVGITCFPLKKRDRELSQLPQFNIIILLSYARVCSQIFPEVDFNR
jgi:hypothetical protein